MKRQFSILALVLMFAVLLTAIPLPVTGNEMVEIVGRWSLDYDVEPVQYRQVDEATIEGSLAETNDPTPYNLDMIDVEKVSQDGEGIYVAVLDTGLMYNWMEYLPVDNIKTEWGKGFSYTTCYWNETAQDFYLDGFYDTRGVITEYGPAYPYGDGHGTHVTSIITGYEYVSSSGEEFWVEGVAPKVNVIPVLVLDTWLGYVPPGQSIPPGWYLVGGGSYEMVASGIQYIGDLAEEHGIKIIINLSLGGPAPSDLVEGAIDYAIDKGCIVVAAAGNEGEAGMDYPGAYPQVISAAAGGWTMEWFGDGVATRWWLSDVPERFNIKDDLGNKFQLYLTDFSGRPNPELGQTISDLDVCTPGAWILGPYAPYGALICEFFPPGECPYPGFGYWYVGGTSQATPHVSGIAALVLEQYSNLDQRDMETIVKVAGVFQRMTKGLKEASATIFDPILGDFVEVSWGPFDYGTGFLQADAAMITAYAYTKIYHSHGPWFLEQ